jgi:flagellar basal body-associated protein FliL
MMRRLLIIVAAIIVVLGVALVVYFFFFAPKSGKLIVSGNPFANTGSGQVRKVALMQAQ